MTYLGCGSEWKISSSFLADAPDILDFRSSDLFHLWPRMKTGTNMDEPRSCCQKKNFSKARLTARLRH